MTDESAEVLEDLRVPHVGLGLAAGVGLGVGTVALVPLVAGFGLMGGASGSGGRPTP